MHHLFYRRHDAGFSLIELMAVIAIIGILSTVMFATYSTARERARDSQRITEIKQLQLGLELYFEACTRTYPGSLSVSANDGCRGSVTFGDFLHTIPDDPQGNAYEYSTTGSSYCLGAVLENENHNLIPDTLPCTMGSANYTVAP